MKATIESEFFCSYFYHSAIKNWENTECILKNPHKFLVPDTYYYAMSAIILFQCTLESYINFMIYDNRADTVNVMFKNRARRLIELPVKSKWLEFPKEIYGRTFTPSQQPFLDFIQLITLRNKLVHFKTKKINITIDLPRDQMSVDELRHVLSQPGALSGHILLDILPVAIAGRDTTHNMICGLHEMVGSSPPKFLSGAESILQISLG